VTIFQLKTLHVILNIVGAHLARSPFLSPLLSFKMFGSLNSKDKAKDRAKIMRLFSDFQFIQVVTMFSGKQPSSLHLPVGVKRRQNLLSNSDMWHSGPVRIWFEWP
jgi:hypothetical protein